MTATTEITRAERTELLSAADPDELRSTAEQCLSVLGAPTVVRPPETGVIVLQVREPVVGDRFQLGEFVTTQAEVVLAGAPGWSCRPGTDRVASLAAAVCDAAADASDDTAPIVDELLRRTTAHLAHDADAARRRLAPTVVEFEELD